MITEDYVSFEIARLLKKKGFDETCYACYEYFSSNITMYSGYPFEYKGEVVHNSNNVIKCPTLQMAMKWLREKKDLYIQPQILNDGTYIAYIYRTDGFGLVGYDKRRVRNSPEEACEAAIKYCLENLI